MFVRCILRQCILICYFTSSLCFFNSVKVLYLKHVTGITSTIDLYITVINLTYITYMAI
jgi:hypothetical protein